MLCCRRSGWFFEVGRPESRPPPSPRAWPWPSMPADFDCRLPFRGECAPRNLLLRSLCPCNAGRTTQQPSLRETSSLLLSLNPARSFARQTGKPALCKGSLMQVLEDPESRKRAAGEIRHMPQAPEKKRRGVDLVSCRLRRGPQQERYARGGV